MAGAVFWRLPFVASHMVNDVSNVSRINPETHFSWQAQYLVELEADSCCTAHYDNDVSIMSATL